jgi:hypothetical protein
MSIYVEHWTARPAWLSLSVPERIRYLDQFGPALEAFADTGGRFLGMVLHEPEGRPPLECQYLALWAMPDGADQIAQLNAILREAGWDAYFERGDAEQADLRPAPPAVAETAARRVGDARLSLRRNGRRW